MIRRAGPVILGLTSLPSHLPPHLGGVIPLPHGFVLPDQGRHLLDPSRARLGQPGLSTYARLHLLPQAGVVRGESLVVGAPSPHLLPPSHEEPEGNRGRDRDEDRSRQPPISLHSPLSPPPAPA